jgi:hypothetical protein
MTAEEFFRKKIKEKYPHQEVVTLADNLITAEDGMRWAYEFSQLPQPMRFHCVSKEISDEEIEDIAWEVYVTDTARFSFLAGAKWYREQLKQRQ